MISSTSCLSSSTSSASSAFLQPVTPATRKRAREDDLENTQLELRDNKRIKVESNEQSQIHIQQKNILSIDETATAVFHDRQQGTNNSNQSASSSLISTTATHSSELISSSSLNVTDNSAAIFNAMLLSQPANTFLPSNISSSSFSSSSLVAEQNQQQIEDQLKREKQRALRNEQLRGNDMLGKKYTENLKDENQKLREQIDKKLKESHITFGMTSKNLVPPFEPTLKSDLDDESLENENAKLRKKAKEQNPPIETGHIPVTSIYKVMTNTNMNSLNQSASNSSSSSSSSSSHTSMEPPKTDDSIKQSSLSKQAKAYNRARNNLSYANCVIYKKDLENENRQLRSLIPSSSEVARSEEISLQQEKSWLKRFQLNAANKTNENLALRQLAKNQTPPINTDHIAVSKKITFSKTSVLKSDHVTPSQSGLNSGSSSSANSSSSSTTLAPLSSAQTSGHPQLPLFSFLSPSQVHLLSRSRQRTSEDNGLIPQGPQNASSINSAQSSAPAVSNPYGFQISLGLPLKRFDTGENNKNTPALLSSPTEKRNLETPPTPLSVSESSFNSPSGSGLSSWSSYLDD